MISAVLWVGLIYISSQSIYFSEVKKQELLSSKTWQIRNSASLQEILKESELQLYWNIADPTYLMLMPGGRQAFRAGLCHRCPCVPLAVDFALFFSALPSFMAHINADIHIHICTYDVCYYQTNNRGLLPFINNFFKHLF